MGKFMRKCSEAVLELLRQEAFEMEFATYDEPWPPSDEIYSSVYSSFANQLFELYGPSTLIASANQVRNGPKPIVKYTLGQRSETQTLNPNETGIGSVSSVVDWLIKQTGGTGSGLASGIKQWRCETPDGLMFLVPYIVKRHPHIKKATADEENARRFYVDRPADREGFMLTCPIVIPTKAGSLSSPLVDADTYFISAWLIAISGEGLLKDIAEVRNSLESLSILFQMSWGYPELVEERKRAARAIAENEVKAREMEVQVRNLAKLKRAAETAQKLSEGLHPLFEQAQYLQRLLVPRPFGLLATYRPASKYIPNTDNEIFYDDLRFMHVWTHEKIALEPNFFRAQFSCILLSYLGEPLPEKWSDSEMPWCKLHNRKLEIPLFSTDFAGTVRKVESECAHSPHHRTRSQVTWTKEDAKSYDILKGCFYYPFKMKHGGVEQQKLTGPLLVLWALERQAILKDQNNFWGVNAVKGKGWPDCRILVGIHGIALGWEEGQPPRAVVSLKGTSQSGGCDGAEITISGFDDEAISKMSEMMGHGSSHDFLEEHLAKRLGDTETYIAIIQGFGGRISFDKANKTAIIKISVEQ